MSRRIRKAILTGGGRATRLRPITATINKHLIPLANKPMIFHAIDKVVEVGVEEIFINMNPGETAIRDAVGDGRHWGIKIKYFEQTGGPQGIAHVVKEAEKFIGNDPFIFYLSDNIVLGSLHELVREYEEGGHDCVLALSHVPDARAFGVPVFDGNGRLTDVLEKPANPPSSYAVTGIYLYGPKIFFSTFDRIQKSARGEYEISSIHSEFLKQGLKIGHREITGFWKDTGKPDDLVHANSLLLDQLPPEAFRREGVVDSSAHLEGHVHLGLGTTVGAGVRIQGPVMVGENCTLEDCTILPHTTIGAGTTIKRATVGESILFNNGYIDADLTIRNSIIGEKARIETGKHETERRFILGDNTSLEV
jgi:glucose-1-phosphate thymidylyltransferase